MQHQVLHAMLGYAGPYLGPADREDTSSCSERALHYECTPLSKSSLSSAEVTSINSTIQYGGHVAYLHMFVRRTEHLFCDVSFDSSNPIGKHRQEGRDNGRCSGGDVPSLYRHAIGRAISTLLDHYETKLLEVEKELRLDNCLGIEYIRATALPATAWVPHVSDFVFELLQCNEEGNHVNQRNQSLSSCVVIDEIDRRIVCCKDEEGCRALEAVLEATHAVLQNQCMTWITQGRLLDPSDEFFIVRSVTDQDEYEVRQDRIPYSSVSFALAGRMLVVGRAARTLRQYGGADDGVPGASHESALTQQQHTRTGSLKLHLERTVSLAYDGVSSRLCDMLRNKYRLLEHLSNIYKLFLHGDGLFYSELLRECETKDIWNKVAQYCTGSEAEKDEWDILGGCWIFQYHIVDAVLARLDGIDTSADSSDDSFPKWHELSRFSIDVRKDAGANAAGQAMEADLFESSQDEASHLSHTDELRLALSSAHDQVSIALSWLDEGHPVLDAGEERENRGNSISAAMAVILSCQYQFPRPVKAIISDDMMESYNRFFRRLFSVHRASYELQKTWRLLVFREYRNARHGMALFSLRAGMEIFVSNLLAYLKQDITAVSFHALQDTLSTTNDYEELIEAHGRFLATLRKGFFLDDPAFNVSFSRILALVHRFTALLQNVENVVDVPAGDITRLRDAFDTETKNNMFGLLRANADSVGLCLRLDFNNFFASSSSSSY